MPKWPEMQHCRLMAHNLLRFLRSSVFQRCSVLAFWYSRVGWQPSRRHKATITLIGAGNLAHALGPALRAAGYRIDVVAARETASSRRRAAMLAGRLGAKAITLEDAGPGSDIIWICHTDDALAETGAQLARKPGWKGKIVFHSSGALTSDVLSPLKRAGAHAASLHPMMTFVPGTTPKMRGVPFAVEGDSRAVAAARGGSERSGRRSFHDPESSQAAVPRSGIIFFTAGGGYAGDGRTRWPRRGTQRQPDTQGHRTDPAADAEKLSGAWGRRGLQRPDQARRPQHGAPPPEGIKARCRSKRSLSRAGEVGFDRFAFAEPERTHETSAKPF